jgi:anti-anti-sigma regulatory factor
MIGDLRGTALEEFKAYSRDACAEGMNIVLDLSRAGYLGPESLASLLHLGAWMRRRQEQLWLAELPAHVSRVLRSGQLHNYFRTTTMVSDALYRTAKAEQQLLADFSPGWGMRRPATAAVDVRVELLQTVCRQIMDAPETEETPGVATVLATAHE